ncbi:hypothetical protein LBMAG21_14660 [Armatimonadota bacterium]|nr:hypothetical protein LBMAG21_14660 [Armatimonadota bacterium]
MSQTVSLRLPEEMIGRLDRFARMLGNGATRARAGLILLDEALKEAEFTGIEFCNTSLGRQPYVKQTGMAVWEFIMVAQEFDMDTARVATHLSCPTESVQSALNYYRAYPDEIDLAIADNDIGEERLKRMFPNLHVTAFAAQGEEPVT